jgi:hypothetical protein
MMRVRRLTRTGLVALGVLATLAIAGAANAFALAPIKLVPALHITNGFEYLESVAVAPNGNIYVADKVNSRIQELTATGQFVLTFGWDVNKKKVKEVSPSQAEKNVCTAAETCQAGVEGSAAEQFVDPQGVAVDPSSGEVYVEEGVNFRVDKYTAAGHFVWMLGKEVNKTTKANLCTPASEPASVCGAGLRNGEPETTEQGAFNFTQAGGTMAVGGPEDLLYVGDEQRVQEFDGEGKWKAEITPAAIDKGVETECSAFVEGCKVAALAVDTTGNVYLVDRVNFSFPPNRVRVFNPGGSTEESFEVKPKAQNTELGIDAIALDAKGLLAVSVSEREGPVVGALSETAGLLYETGAHLGHVVTTFSMPSASGGMRFDNNADANAGFLYAPIGQEVLVYKPVFVAELLSSPAACKAGAEHESDATFACTLNGEVNPEGVPQTAVWFQWGRTPTLGPETPHLAIATGSVLEPVAPAPAVEGLRPNATYYYRLAGFDENVQAPESPLSSETDSFATDYVAPNLVGEQSASFVKSSSAVLTGELNPENAETEYFFEYGQGSALENCAEGVRKAAQANKSCAGVSTTEVVKSSIYGKAVESLEVGGLQSGARYRYRAYAASENNARTERRESIGPEGEFTTSPAPVVRAMTGPPSAISATSAVVSGTADPDGQEATYTFELGVYAGASTQYGVVLSGLAGAGVEPVPETLALTGLQPGTSYAYKIKVASGYSKAEGEPVIFTTSGLPEVVPVAPALPMLAIPKIAFPKPTSTTSVKTLTNKEKLSKALKVCKKDKSKSKRTKCEAAAHKKYPTGSKKKKKKK